MATNRKYTVLSLAARTATPADFALVNNECRGLMLLVNVTVLGATATLTPSVRTVDDDGNSSPIWTAAAAISAANAAGAPFIYYLYPSAAGTAAGGVTEMKTTGLPEILSIRMAHGNNVSITYSVRAYLLV